MSHWHIKTGVINVKCVIHGICMYICMYYVYERLWIVMIYVYMTQVENIVGARPLTYVSPKTANKQ